MASTNFTNLTDHLAKAAINFSTDSFKCMLVTSVPSEANFDAWVNRSDVTNEHAATGGYTAGCDGYGGRGGYHEQPSERDVHQSGPGMDFGYADCCWVHHLQEHRYFDHGQTGDLCGLRWHGVQHFGQWGNNDIAASANLCAGIPQLLGQT